ncbi:DEAD/DEAH box helicase family protein [Aureisphaera sp. CAU 1614]|uniref:DEAD/DEAH box helicase family protein n=1 Tax=Halomarinibacterium sedimenti TaxID=2857106 RepID=A0A9X1JZP5_9FLAO|nr:DEAD/DEAH box helicase family protein [Halomarinibacterium sedimenti]MBW2937531.1 DEAD/DEAH box helicase family protein [Halomarinibacterium sedimenti]
MSKLKIHFESDQEHQVRAIESTVKLFQGYIKRNLEELKASSIGLGSKATEMYDTDIIANIGKYEMLDETWLYDNLLEVQKDNGLVEDMFLNFDDGFEITGIDSWRYPYYTCEMETGTGKTYVYLRTIHELRKKYGWGKYIIIVPSVAIYEGVVKTFKITKDHFASLYNNETIHLTQYSGQHISKLRSFANSSAVEVMVMTIDSFNKESNVIFKPTEKLQGEKLPYQYIQETRPILLLDESQNYTSAKSKEALRTLHPFFAIKYSATPTEKGNTSEENRELMNRFYHLSPVDAFKMDLVKKIEVLGVTEQNNFNDNQLSMVLMEERAGYGLALEAKLNVIKNGEVKTESIKLRKGDDLFEKTKNENFKGLVIEEINKSLGVVIFTNGKEYKVAEGGDVTLSKEEIFRVQIEETIKSHMKKQKQLINKGVKVLSLFFIDKVANYVETEGIIKKLFDEAYERLKNQYPFYSGWSAEQVREGYFAKKKTKNKADVYIDTSVDKKTKAEKELEREAYNLIMKDKEKLLSFDEKTSFIFAHSALKEGWDNPNVFQICTLNTATSENRKRQEIGRGLRLSVNQEGRRVTDEGVNVLTVIANESYESYCEQLQNNYRETGDAAPPTPSNARKTEAKRNNTLFNSEAFNSFWKKLCQKTDYKIMIDEDQLVSLCINKLNIAKYPEPNIVVVKGRFVMTDFKITLKKVVEDIIKLEILKSDSDGNEEKIKRNFKVGDDLAKIAKDERLKGFKIVDAKADEDRSEIVFSDKGILRSGEAITFSSEKGQKGDPQHRHQAQTIYPIFNFIERAEEATHLKRATLFTMFKGLNYEVKEKIFKNPEGFTSVFIDIIKGTLADHIAANVEYSLTKELMDYDSEDMFPEARKFPQKELIDGSNWSLYNQVQIDSDIERRFVEYKLNEDDNVVCFFKFPSQFKISIPKIIGNYNPDWGIIRWDDNNKFKLELVRETKGNVNPNLLQFPNEKRKIDCATKHFKLTKVDYKQIKGDEVIWW